MLVELFIIHKTDEDDGDEDVIGFALSLQDAIDCASSHFFSTFTTFEGSNQVSFAVEMVKNYPSASMWKFNVIYHEDNQPDEVSMYCRISTRSLFRSGYCHWN